MRFKIGWAILIVGSKFTVFALFYFVLQFSKYKPLGCLYLEGRFNAGFLALPVWGAYIWRGSFLEFYVLRLSILVFEWEKYYCPQLTGKREPWEQGFGAPL